MIKANFAFIAPKQNVAVAAPEGSTSFLTTFSRSLGVCSGLQCDSSRPGADSRVCSPVLCVRSALW